MFTGIAETMKLSNFDKLLNRLAPLASGTFQKKKTTPPRNILIYILYFSSLFPLNAQYISEVIEYQPAPGQLINTNPWGMPASGETLVGTTNGSMSLGAFGGYVIFKFDGPVINHPDNPYGVDFTIFGNAAAEWSEPGIVSVMKDENKNGLPDDQWFELAGSDYFFTSTLKKYQVTYTNPKETTAADVLWTDNHGQTGFIFKNIFHTQAYYPLPENFGPGLSESLTLKGTVLKNRTDKNSTGINKSFPRAFGYTDNHSRGTAPFTLPDNPYTLEKENAGGDPFDIGWAVDDEGNYVELDEIDFVKIHTALLASEGWLGEVSTEITGAAIVAPAPGVKGELEMVVIEELPDTLYGNSFQLSAYAFNTGRWDKNRRIDWEVDGEGAEVNETRLLTFSSSGKVTLTASLEDRPEIEAQKTTMLIYEDPLSSLLQFQNGDIQLFPNPVTDHFFLEGIDHVSLEIFNITGKKIFSASGFSGNEPVSVSQLKGGCYILKINGPAFSKTLRFIKK